MRQYLVEFIGTFFLVLIIGLTGNPLVIGLTLMAMVYIGGHISGAHYNPAISLAVMMRGALKRNELIQYWVVQIAAAFFAAGAVFMFMGNQLTVIPNENIELWKIIMIEILFTFVLALVVLTEGTTKKFSGSHTYGLSIGLTLIAIIFAGSQISGAVYNPAVALGPALLNITMGASVSSVFSIWAYLIGPLLGGVIAAITYKFLNPKE